MKNSTLMKGLLAASLVLSANVSVLAQEESETPEGAPVVYQMVDQVTSGKSYVIGINTEEGWYAARPPFGWFYPIYGRVLCQDKFELNDDMQIVLDPTQYLSSFVFTKDDKGYLIKGGEDAYLSVEKPYDDGKGDGKDDGKDPVEEYRFVLDKELSDDYYWNISFSDDLGGFKMSTKNSNINLGVYGEMLTSEGDEGVTVTYDYRIVAYEKLPEDMVAPIYLFELVDQTSGIGSVNNDVNAPKTVYNLSGMKVGNTTEGLKSGIYIVKQGNSVKKVVVD